MFWGAPVFIDRLWRFFGPSWLNCYNHKPKEVRGTKMKILLGTLKDRGDELAAFLEPRIGVKPEVGGGELDIEDSSIKKGIRSRHVKTYIKRFLSMKKVRDDYRVLVESGELRLVELEGEEEEEEEKKGRGKEEAKPAEKATEKESASNEKEAEAQKPAEEGKTALK
jgi:hypothetical protein